MRKQTLLFAAIALMAGTILTTTSCNKKDDAKPIETTTSAEVKTVTSLEAESKVYFNLTTGEQVTASAITATNWDISFYGKDRVITIAVNSGTEGSGTAGAQLLETGFTELTEAPESGYQAGSTATGDYLKWSTYTGGTTAPLHAILPKPGLTFAIKTADGKYSKLQILSLYKGNPNTSTPEFADLTTRPAFGYFTFRYATQTGGGRKF